jgi:GSH-dependent disulfide-bond oxidoreductase
MEKSITLLGAPTGNCVRAAIALEEARIPYVVRHVDLKNGEHRAAEYLALNPAGRVPTLVEHREGEPPFVLSQSNAIMLYAARKAPGRLLPAAEGRARALTLERFFLFITDVIAPNHAAFYVRPRGEQRAADLLEERSVDVLKLAEKFVADTPFLAGENYSIADIAAFTITMSVRKQLAWSELPALARWYSIIEQRPAVTRGLKAFVLS